MTAKLKRTFTHVIRLETGDEIELRLQAMDNVSAEEMVNRLLNFSQIEKVTGKGWSWKAGAR
jgi:hypothetical protein